MLEVPGLYTPWHLAAHRKGMAVIMDIVEPKKPILILSYNNCEIYCCHLDGYKADRDALLNRMSEIEAVFLSKPAQNKYRIWYNIDENHLDKDALKLVAESISRYKEHICKIAFIGLRGFKQKKFNKILEQILKGESITKAYFQDAQLAKGWLI